VIGSAFERIVEENLNSPDLAKRLVEQVGKYREAMRTSPATEE
jgi:hypothetical protein